MGGEEEDEEDEEEEEDWVGGGGGGSVGVGNGLRAVQPWSSRSPTRAARFGEDHPSSSPRRRNKDGYVVPPSPSSFVRRSLLRRGTPTSSVVPDDDDDGGAVDNTDRRGDDDDDDDDAGGNDVRPMLQPDAIYDERYGDAYVDGHVNYLYPPGYQSMRPRSGPWRLSAFVFVTFACLCIFVVGHCYDRGVREYYHDGVVDDTYLMDVDDDTLVMETRWCGSRPLYFVWYMSVWITVMSMSYCSIIGYVKVRDFVVANGRSQPAGTASSPWGGRSDYYYIAGDAEDATSKGGGRGDGRGGGGRATTSCPVPQAAYAAVSPSPTMSGSEVDGSAASGTTTANPAYPSYQDGIPPPGGGRYVPSIYQSDGTPQFWGGHIYRPTQAAVAMTNRP